MSEAERRSLGLRTLVDPGPPEAWVASRDSRDEASARGSVGLSCRDLSFSYGNTPVFESFDADFPGGQITCIAGENGVGKNDPRARAMWSGRSQFRNDHPGRTDDESTAATGRVRARHAGHRAAAVLRHRLAGELTIGASQASGEAGGEAFG